MQIFLKWQQSNEFEQNQVLKMESQLSKLEHLDQAIRSNDFEAVRKIITKDPGLLHPSSSDLLELHISPLWEAIFNENEEIVDLFCHCGANVNELYKSSLSGMKLTYFHFLANSETLVDSKIAKILIKYGADLNFTNDELRLTPLQLSAFVGNLRSAEFLLINGASFTDPELTIRILLLNNKFNCKKMLLLFLKYGLDINFHNEMGQNLLHIISVEGNKGFFKNITKIAKILLNKGVPLDVVTEDGQSPLHYAVISENFQLVSLLIKKGADVNKKSFEGIFPLFLAVEYNYKNLITLLLSEGAKVNTQTSRGVTALQLACSQSNEEIISLLIQNGADIRLEDNNGETAFGTIRFDKEESEKSAVIMIKEFAKLNFENEIFSKKDMNLIKNKLVLAKHFKNCEKELSEMSCIKFYPPYSYYGVLMMSKNIKNLANLLKNEEFKKAFEKNLSFSYYKDDLQRIFDEAIKLTEKLVFVYSSLLYIFDDHLPDVVIRKLAENLTPEDLP